MLKNAKSIFTLLSFLSLTLFIFTSCEEEDIEEILNENIEINQSTADNADVEAEFEDVGSVVDDVMGASEVTDVINARTEAVVTVTTDDGCEVEVTIDEAETSGNNKSRKVTIEFTGNCRGQRTGRLRQGKIISILTVPQKMQITTTDGTSTEIDAPFSLQTLNAQRQVTFDGYSVNGVQVEGTRVVTNLAESLTAIPRHSVSVTGGKLTFPEDENGEVITTTWSSERIREWSEGTDIASFPVVAGGTIKAFEVRLPNLNAFDDVFKLYGTYEGVNRQGNAYTATVEEANAIETHTACWTSQVFMPVKGTMTIVSEGNTAVIDYGDGTCDRVYTVTINGTTYTVDRDARNQ